MKNCFLWTSKIKKFQKTLIKNKLVFFILDFFLLECQIKNFLRFAISLKSRLPKNFRVYFYATVASRLKIKNKPKVITLNCGLKKQSCLLKSWLSIWYSDFFLKFFSLFNFNFYLIKDYFRLFISIINWFSCSRNNSSTN